MSSKEYIEREALIKGIVDIINTAPMIYVGGLGLSLTSVRSAPAADVAPVRHGRWIRHYEPYDTGEEWIEAPCGFECSECGRWEAEQEPFCNCGAIMDKEDTNGSQTD